MGDIDQWAAEQCGVTVIPAHEDGCYYVNESWSHRDSYNHVDQKWTLDDARCREIVREHFRIVTEYKTYADGDSWVAHEWMKFPPVKGLGKTIAEAEIKCIEVIYENRHA